MDTAQRHSVLASGIASHLIHIDLMALCAFTAAEEVVCA